MKRKTSEIIASLQRCVKTYGDLPFEICDNDNGVDYFDISIFANTVSNGGAEEETEETIGIAF